MFDVRSLGATPSDGKNDTAAIQAAIDAAHAAGGGRVVLQEGDYHSGALILRSNITFDIQQGTTLYASPREEDYPGAEKQLFLAENAENIWVVGPGRIHGSGTEPLGHQPGRNEPVPPFRVGTLLFKNCRNIHLRDITILFSDSWTVYLQQCDGVVIDGIKIQNNYFRTNADGIDPNSSRNVRITNCNISTGGDCIALEAATAMSCENVVVSNCTLRGIGTALKLGAESAGDFRDIHISNCTIRNTLVGIGLFMKDGGTMERVSFSNISIENADPELVALARDSTFPIFMGIEKRHEDSRLGVIRDVQFQGIQIETQGSIVVQGTPRAPIEGLTFRDISVRVHKNMDFTQRGNKVGGNRTTTDDRDRAYAQFPSYMTLAHVDGLTLDNFRVHVARPVHEGAPRAAFLGDTVKHGVIQHVELQPGGVEQRVVLLKDAEDVQVSRPGLGTKNQRYLEVTGEKTVDVGLNGARIGTSRK